MCLFGSQTQRDLCAEQKDLKSRKSMMQESGRNRWEGLESEDGGLSTQVLGRGLFTPRTEEGTWSLGRCGQAQMSF